MKIYDCTTFYNEFDLLEIRLLELWNSVDKFVIVEANTTHIGTPKPFYLADNWERFKKYSDKIIHVLVNDMPQFNPEDKFCLDRFQRQAIVRGLTDANDHDIMIMSDQDELVRTSCVNYMRHNHSHSLWAFRMPLFNFKFNYMCVQGVTYNPFSQAIKIDRFRSDFNNDTTALRYWYGFNWVDNRPLLYDDGKDLMFQHGGWHFSSLGNTQHVKNKLKTYSHIEYQSMADSFEVDQLISQGKTTINDDFKFEPVCIDTYFPKSILDYQHQLTNYIIPDISSENTVMSKFKKIKEENFNLINIPDYHL